MIDEMEDAEEGTYIITIKSLQDGMYMIIDWRDRTEHVARNQKEVHQTINHVLNKGIEDFPIEIEVE